MKRTCWHFLCAHSPGICFSHHANSTIIYLVVLMRLTQVMLQVKDSEMVCKQTELIPRPKQLSPACPEMNRFPPPFLFSSAFYPSYSSSSSTLNTPFAFPALFSLPNSLWQHSAESVKAIKKVPKHSVKYRLLTKMRLDQNQYACSCTTLKHIYPPAQNQLHSYYWFSRASLLLRNRAYVGQSEGS